MSIFSQSDPSAELISEVPAQGIPAPPGGMPPYLLLDAWRGLAILVVVGFHATKGVLNRFPALETHPFYAAGLWGWLGVQLFFVISGYCIVGAAFSALRRSAFPVREFALARLRRIYPPCWFALFGAALFSLAAAKMAAHGYLHPDAFTQVGVFRHSAMFYFSNLTLTQILVHQSILLDVTWSLCYEVAFYFIVALLLLPLSWAKSGRNVLNTLHGLTGACLLLLLLAPSRSFYPLDLWPQFGLGVVVYDWLSHPRQRAPKLWAIAIGIQTLLLAALDTGTLGAMQQPARPACLVSLAFAALLLVLYRCDVRLNRSPPIQWLSAVGLFSYSLYLTHTLTLRAVNQVSGFLHLTDPRIVFPLGILITLIVARLFFQFFERPFIHARKRA